MPPKRGQITVFIIIGVVLIAALGLFFYLKSLTVEKGVEVVPTDVASVKLYVEKCLEETAKDAVLTVALQGGYYHLPERSGVFRDVNNDPEMIKPFITVPYYVYDGELIVPTKKDMESQLSAYIADELPNCIDTEALIEKGINIEAGTPEINSTIGDKEIFFKAIYPITLSQEGDIQTISDFTADLEASLMKLYNIAGEYSRYQKLDPYVFFISKLNRLAAENDVFLRSLSFIGDDVMITIIDNSSVIRDQPLIFAFAVKYPEIDFNKYLPEGISEEG